MKSDQTGRRVITDTDVSGKPLPIWLLSLKSCKLEAEKERLVLALLKAVSDQVKQDLRLDRVGSDQRITNSLSLEPGKEKMPPFVRGKRSGNPSGNRITFEHSADTTITVFVFAYRLEEIA